LDIAVLGKEKITLNRLAQAEEEFSSSEIPFRVDLVDLRRCGALLGEG
jgi:hypothetical protein